jgi:thiol:disulfide interchange protein DsbC
MTGLLITDKPVFIWKVKDMKKLVQASLLACLSLSCALATAASVSDTTVATITKNLKANLPDLVIDKVESTPIAGVYEIDSGRKVFYVDGSGNYALIGNLLDLTTKTSLTEQRSNDLNQIDWKKLPTDLAITRVKGNGKSKIAIFTDPDCPFCKRLEAETTSKLKDVTIYYYLFPLVIHANAADDSKRILCAENPESSMIAFMAYGKSLGKNNTCDNGKKLVKMQEIGSNLVQVTGTPTIVLPNGKIISGLVPADALSRMIDQNQAESSESAVIPAANKK